MIFTRTLDYTGETSTWTVEQVVSLLNDNIDINEHLYSESDILYSPDTAVNILSDDMETWTYVV